MKATGRGAAVDGQYAACDELGRRRAQEFDGVRDFVWSSEATPRNILLDLFAIRNRNARP
jgi:hypothetical protein